MKQIVAALAALTLPAAACAQTPEPPQPPETPDVSTITEDCGDNCTRTTTTIRTADVDEDGNGVISKKVEIIELVTGDEALADIDIDVETDTDVRKRVKIVTATDGEITPEMREKIDALIADVDKGEGYAFKQDGDGLIVMSSNSDIMKTRVIVRDGDQEILDSSGNVTIDQVENEDGSRTIRIVPEDGSGETTVITIQKESSSKSDN